MSWLRTIAVMCSVLAASSAFAEPAADAPVDQTKAFVQKMAETYRAAPTISDSVDLSIKAGGTEQKFTIAVDIGKGTDARVAFGGFAMTALGQDLYITRTGLDTKYYQIPLDRNLPLTVLQLPGSGPLPLPHFTLKYGTAEEDPNLAFNMGMPLGLTAVKVEESTRDGRAIHKVHLEGPQAKGTAEVDAETMMIRQIQATLTPRNGMPGSGPVYTMKMNPAAAPELSKPITFDTAGMKRVTDSSELALVVGDVTPDVQLLTDHGKALKLSELRGSYVVMDFWATWCGPCKRGLPLLNEFQAWADTQASPRIAVFAVNVREIRDPGRDSVEQRLVSAKNYWGTTKLDVPMVLDARDELFSLFNFDSIPAMVILGPDGKVLKIHKGYDPELVSKLKADFAEFTAPKPG